jgi:hypothetical protein
MLTAHCKQSPGERHFLRTPGPVYPSNPSLTEGIFALQLLGRIHRRDRSISWRWRSSSSTYGTVSASFFCTEVAHLKGMPSSREKEYYSQDGRLPANLHIAVVICLLVPTSVQNISCPQRCETSVLLVSKR